MNLLKLWSIDAVFYRVFSFLDNRNISMLPRIRTYLLG